MPQTRLPALSVKTSPMPSRRGGRSRQRRVLAALLATTLTLAPGRLLAADDDQTPLHDVAASLAPALPSPSGEPTRTQIRQGYACLIAASTGMALVGVAGSSEFLHIYTAGEVVYASSLTLWVTMFVVVGATACSAASAATPALINMWNYVAEENAKKSSTR